MRFWSIGIFVLIIGGVTSVNKTHAQETTILYDYARYTLDYRNLEKIRAHFRRGYQIVIKQTRDIDLLRNVSIEVNRQAGEQLEEASVIVKRTSTTLSPDSFPRDSFKLQPFDALMAEYICRIHNIKLGDTLQIQYTISSQPGTDIIRWDLSRYYPVERSLFEWLLPEGAVYYDHVTNPKFLKSETNIDSIFISGRSKIPCRGTSILFQDIPPRNEEIFSIPNAASDPAVLLSIGDLQMGDLQIYMPSWTEQVTDLSVNEYFGKQYRLRTAYRWLADKAEPILSTRYTPKLMILKLYEWVHEQLEWNGDYGLFPGSTIEEMSQNRSVNKAGLNMALLALLQEGGFKANPVLVSTTEVPAMVREIPNVNQFNHFIIQVELKDEVLYLDAGDPLLPVGFIDSGIRRSDAIIIKNYKGNWISIPDFHSESTITVRMEIRPDYSARGEINVSFQGYDAFNERHQLKGDPKGVYWKERAASISNKIRVDSVRFNHVRNLLEPFTNKIYFHIDPSDDQEELALFPIFYSFFNQLYFTDSIRNSSVHFPSVISEHVVFNIIMPEGFAPKSLPASLKMRMENNFGEMEYLSSSERNQLQVNFKIQNKMDIPAENYPALKQYFSEVYKKLSEKIVISRERNP